MKVGAAWAYVCACCCGLCNVMQAAGTASARPLLAKAQIRLKGGLTAGCLEYSCKRVQAPLYMHWSQQQKVHLVGSVEGFWVCQSVLIV
jgi:hypothetical protein